MPHKLLKSYNFTPHYFNIYFLIEFQFYSIIKPSIRILTHHIFFNTSRKPVRCMEKLLNMIFKEKIHQIMQSHANCTQYKTELVLVKL